MAQPMDLWTVILTSVAVGTIVGSIVSSLFGFISQHLERRARRRELAMKTAAEEHALVMKTCTDWALKHWEHARELTKLGMRIEIPALSWLAYEYHQHLDSLMKDGRLPPEVQQTYNAWLRQAEQGRGANVPHAPGSPASG